MRAANLSWLAKPTRNRWRHQPHQRAVTMIDILASYPETEDDRAATAQLHLPRLLRAWQDGDLGERDTLYIMLCRPGELARSPEAATHLEDQGQAMAADAGMGVAVQLVLTDIQEGAERFVALRWRAPGPGVEGVYSPGIDL